MATVRILVVEDEIIVAQDIAMRLQVMGYEVVAITDTGQGALETLKQQAVDLVLLDINLLGNEDGIDTAGKIANICAVPIIYLTSLSDPETVKRASATRPSAYMLKPFNDRELQIAIDIAIANFSAGQQASAPQEDASAVPAESGHFVLDNCIFIKDQYRYQRVDFADMLWAEASGNYTQIRTSEKSFLLSVTLSKIEDKLVYPPFMRVHRSFCVNLTKVTAFEGNRLFVGTSEIPVSKTSRDQVFKHFTTM